MTTDQIDVSITVSREGTTDLELEDPASGVEVVTFGLGGREWIRDTVEGRYFHGRVMLNKRLATGTAFLVLRVLGGTWQEVRTRHQAVVDAFSQDAYLLTATIDGVTDVRVCEAADIAPAGGDEWNKFEIMAGQHQWLFSIPYDPVRTAL